MQQTIPTRPFQWPHGEKCAVTLTYDDGLPIHYQLVEPLLQERGIRGTFNVPIHSDLLHHPEKWRELAANGHELANHTIFHPCRKRPHQTWLPPCYDLHEYTPRRLRDELVVANSVLSLIDGKDERTYGNTCCDTVIGPEGEGTVMDAILNELFVAARGPHNDRIADPQAGINLMQVGHFAADRRTARDIQADIERAQACGGWIIFMIHGVGEETHNHFIAPSEHEQIVTWLGNNKGSVWTGTFMEVAKYVKNGGDGVSARA